MSKYHINAKGEAGACHANQGGCPFGGESEHYPTAIAARQAYEKAQSPLASAPQAFSKKKLAELGVDDDLAQKIISSGFSLDEETFYEEIRATPIYVGEPPKINERIKVTRTTFSESGDVRKVETHFGKFVDVKNAGEGFGTGDNAIVIDSKEFTEFDVESLSAESLRKIQLDGSDGHWMRLRTNGAIRFTSGRLTYIEHDSIERVGPEDPTLDEQNEAIEAKNKAIIQAKNKEEARARRPWPFNRIGAS